MQAAHLPYDLIRRSQMQVIGIGQLHLTADFFQVFGAQCALDGALGAHVHKHRGLDSAVGTGKFAPPCFSFRFFQFKHSYLTKYTWHRQS